MKARDVMTQEVRFIRFNASVEEAAGIMTRHDLEALPVFRDGYIIGIVSDQDIVRRGLGAGRDPRRTRVEEVMSDEVPCCYEDQDLEVAEHIMSRKGVRRLLVVNVKRRPVGIVSLRDLDPGRDAGSL